MEAYLGKETKDELEEWMQKDTMMAKPNVLNGEYATYYSFLLQHKEHRIVKKIEHNYVLLLQRGTVYQDGHITVEDNVDNEFSFQIPNTSQSMNDWFLQTFSQQPYDFQGVVFKDGFGNRWRTRAEKYKMVKSLRGNQAGVVERYSQLFVQNLQYMYLDYYPEDAMTFALQSACMTTAIDCIYRAYKEMHIVKAKSTAELLEQIDKMYHPHLYALHGIYLTQLRPTSKKMSLDVIRNYFHKLPWQRIAFLLRKTQNMYLTMIHSALADS
jgi:Txe/YoeB family toxin of Txe-Axe toxin-antitoxin module